MSEFDTELDASPRFVPRKLGRPPGAKTSLTPPVSKLSPRSREILQRLRATRATEPQPDLVEVDGNTPMPSAEERAAFGARASAAFAELKRSPEELRARAVSNKRAQIAARRSDRL